MMTAIEVLGGGDRSKVWIMPWSNDHQYARIVYAAAEKFLLRKRATPGVLATVQAIYFFQNGHEPADAVALWIGERTGPLPFVQLRRDATIFDVARWWKVDPGFTREIQAEPVPFP